MSLLVQHARVLDVDGIREDSWLLADSGTIQAVGAGETWRQQLDQADGIPDVVDAAGSWLTPGFIDLHAHGAGGRRFEEGGGALEAALEVHRRRGTTRSVISLASHRLDALKAVLADVADLAKFDEHLRRLGRRAASVAGGNVVGRSCRRRSWTRHRTSYRTAGPIRPANDARPDRGDPSR
jgi:N-acetylglucosamine-6-phosphate deacetylase